MTPAADARDALAEAYASAEDRLPAERDFDDSAVILGEMRVGSVHKASYGHKFDWSTA